MHTHDSLKTLLQNIKDGTLDIEGGMEALRNLPYHDLGHTKLDMHRALRNGFPEVIYAAGKTPEQVAEIFGHLHGKSNVLATRVDEATAAIVKSRYPEAEYNPLGRTLTYIHEPPTCHAGEIRIITAGTSDLGVAEEARVTCETFGHRATILSDVGVAGIHRLFDRMDELRSASVLIVIAGMEGALASVIGGLVHQPVIAVPTSVGYGANFSGLSALLGMLTSCAAGITVVNIDNGYGAACAACRINALQG